jgi:glyceraldehyde-3-phosphate dehydrogenase (NAD(P))
MDAVHVIGTGTIGEPLIGLLADLRKELGIDEETSARNPGEVVGFSFTPQDD